MSLSADTLLSHFRLKGQVRMWRGLAIIMVTLTAILVIGQLMGRDFSRAGGDFIARVHIKGIILSNDEHIESLKKLAKNSAAKAVIIRIDSPGGTAIGGEVLYDTILQIKTEKPVVAVIGNMATSAAYLLALGTDRIFAHKGSITGSIGVLMEIPNISGLAEKIGIKMKIVKTGALKGEPSIFQEMSSETEIIMQEMINDFYQYFISVIMDNRNLTEEEVKTLADGRIFSGRQAVENGLIDELGGESKAITWLEKNKNINESLEVREVDLEKKQNKFEKLLTSLSNNSLIPNAFSMHGLLSIWRDGAIN